MTGALHIEDEEEVREARIVFDQLRTEALNPADSVAMIERLAVERGDWVSAVDLSGLTWRKSSRSGGNGDNGACVEVAFAGPVVAVRDSKNPAAGVLAFPAAAFPCLLRHGANDRDNW